MIIPRAKKIKYSKIKYQLGFNFSYSVNEQFGDFAIKWMKNFYSDLIMQKEEYGLFHFILSNGYNQGAYSIKSEHNISIFYSDKEGARNAAASIIQLMSFKEGKGYEFPYVQINDSPDCNFRSVMIDLARGIPNLSRLKEDLLRLSLLKCNFVHFHLMDGGGVCYKTEVFPQKLGIGGQRLLSKAELHDLVAFCEDLGLNVIPEIEIPAHADALLYYVPELACKTKLNSPSKWCVCAGNEMTYELFDKLIQEISEIFPGKYLHIGGDELYFDDIPEMNRHCHWLECERCKALMEKERLNSIQEIYYYVINRIYNIVKKYNKQMIVWNDQIDVSKAVPISKDIIVQYWRIANKNRGPRKGCSYQKILRNGFQVINSVLTHCYIDDDLYANPEKISAFSYLNIPKTEKKYKNSLIGCEACAWNYGLHDSHYLLSFFFSTGLLLDKMWNVSDVVYNQKFKIAITKVLFGAHTPKGYDVCEVFGSIIPPRIDGQCTYAEIKNDLMDIETLNRHRKIWIAINNTYSTIYKNRLLDCFK